MIHAHPTRKRRSVGSFALSTGAEALVALGYLPSRLEEGSVLHVAWEPHAAFGFLLEWLRPRRLATHEIAPAAPIDELDRSLDGLIAFVDASDPCRGISVREWERVLKPGGVLVVCENEGTELGRRDRSDWSLLHEKIARRGFEICEEHLGTARVLVANATPRRRPLSSRALAGGRGLCH